MKKRVVQRGSSEAAILQSYPQEEQKVLRSTQKNFIKRKISPRDGKKRRGSQDLV